VLLSLSTIQLTLTHFSRAQGAASNAKANKVARFLPSPEANWDSKPKHGRPFKVCTYVSYTNQSLGLRSALPGHCLAVSAVLFTVFVCSQKWPCFQPRLNYLSVVIAMRLCPVNVCCSASGCALHFCGFCA